MKITNGRQTITATIAYIAGFFDGEGCVRLKQSNQNEHSYYVIAHITNSNRAILEQVQDLFGGTIRMQEHAVNKTIYNWQITSAEAVDFLQTLSPFLQDKLEQALLAIKYHAQKGELTPAERASYVRIISEMKKQDRFPAPEFIGKYPESFTSEEQEKTNE
jgi:LAGLIDADG-like domain